MLILIKSVTISAGATRGFLSTPRRQHRHLAIPASAPNRRAAQRGRPGGRKSANAKLCPAATAGHSAFARTNPSWRSPVPYRNLLTRCGQGFRQRAQKVAVPSGQKFSRLKWRRGSIQSVPRQQDLREARAWRSCGEPIKDLNVLRFFCVGAPFLGFPRAAR